MTDIRFENILANFCSPVLMNRKVSNMVSISKKEAPDISALVEIYGTKLEMYRIKIETLCECGQRILLLVYREDLLSDYLREKEVYQVLLKYGYGNAVTVDDYLSILKSRMDMKSFPHEIGIFLGYPISDVRGFIDNKGLNYEYCGYWKVYGDPIKAKKTFSMYDKLKAFVVGELKSGRKLDTIVAQFQNINIA